MTNNPVRGYFLGKYAIVEAWQYIPGTIDQDILVWADPNLGIEKVDSAGNKTLLFMLNGPGLPLPAGEVGVVVPIDEGDYIMKDRAGLFLSFGKDDWEKMAKPIDSAIITR